MRRSPTRNHTTTGAEELSAGRKEELCAISLEAFLREMRADRFRIPVPTIFPDAFRNRTSADERRTGWMSRGSAPRRPRAVAAGAAHPLGAPVALRALAPLVAPLEKDTASADARMTKTKTFFPGAPGVADPRSHALALRLLAELWKHHRGSFPRLKAALEHAVLSPSPGVRIGAAAAR